MYVNKGNDMLHSVPIEHFMMAAKIIKCHHEKSCKFQKAAIVLNNELKAQSKQILNH